MFSGIARLTAAPITPAAAIIMRTRDGDEGFSFAFRGRHLLEDLRCGGGGIENPQTSWTQHSSALPTAFTLETC